MKCREKFGDKPASGERREDEEKETKLQKPMGQHQKV